MKSNSKWRLRINFDICDIIDAIVHVLCILLPCLFVCGVIGFIVAIQSDAREAKRKELENIEKKIPPDDLRTFIYNGHEYLMRKNHDGMCHYMGCACFSNGVQKAETNDGKDP